MAKQFKEPVVDFGFRHPDENTPPAEPAAAAPPPTPVSDAFRAKAEQWKRDLLDVTRRNRAINYRSAKSSLSLPADPEELFERLVATDGETAFTARNYAPDAAVPVDDERAVAAFDAASRLADRARLADREQGIQVLFLALAWLNWSDNEGHELRSPLLLAPVDLTFDRQDKQIVVQAAADDAAEVNPSLAYLLASQYGLRLPQIEDAEGDPTFPTLAAFVEKVAETVANQPSWSVEVDGPIVDVFAFAKLAMVDEIERRLADFAQHPILRGLAGDGALPEPPETTDGPLDARYAPGKLRLVVDADAYQLQAVALAATGRSFVIEGPPGTGKSQTITNIISELMAQGKRVLFVAEKRVAREVVLDNLRSAGLAEAALHLASNAGATSRADAKAQVIKEIVDTLDAGPPPPPPDAALPTRYGALRQRLNAYSDAISRPLGDGGWTTTFDVLGAALTQSSDFRDGIAIPPIAGKARYWLDDVADAAKALDDFPPDAVALLATPWAELKWTSAAGGEEQRLRSALETLAHLEVGAAELIGPALGPSQPVPGDHSIEQIEAIRQGFVDVADYRRKASSILRFVNPAFYSAKGKYKKFLTAGYRETGVEATAAESVRALIEQARAALATCSDAFGAATPASAGATQISAWAKGLMAGLGQFEEVVQMAAVLGGLSSLEMREPFIQLLADTSTHRRMATVVPATVYGVWARQLSQGDLATTPEQHARLVDSFARLDGEMIGWGRAAVLSTVRDKRPRSVNHSAMAPLVKYARAKRRPALRTMLGNSREAVQLLKPCLLMSPLSAAQYLCHGAEKTYRFDAVIVDEASMIPTPDMVVALSLAPQAIIVGDSKQMPPTNFFNKEISPISDDEEDVTFESILDEAAPLLSSTMLRAHYRSRDESLIAFSNVYFYDGRLIAFPDAWGNRPESGVRFELVGDAVYGRGKSRANPAEAARAIELLRAELQASEGKRQVAITAMSLAQQSEILDQLTDAAALDPLIRGWVEGGGLVRNLETVQGDESDVMLLSVGYGKDSEGRLFMNFGPLGQEKGERRLNVAITRAKWKTVVVTSLRSGDIDPSRTSSTGTLRLRDYLDYAERGPVALPAAASTAGPGPTAFEQVLLKSLTTAGLDCVPRVGVGGYQVDVAVRHPQDRERFVLAIECDGPSYFTAPSARDRELGRKAALERMGWNVHRVFSTAWLRNPEAELGRVLERYRQATL